MLNLTTFFPKTKFTRDVSWNALSFAVMGISGIVLNILIVMKYGAEILGAFNQVYAIYILVSQLAVFGLYASVLKHISEHSENPDFCDEILTSALLIGIGIASFVCLLYYGLTPFAGRLLDSPAVAQGLIFALVGLWCFSLNKILLAFLNGKRLMKAFALFNVFRYVMMPLFLAVLILLRMPGYILPVIFSITELILLVALLVFTFRFFSIASINRCKKWFKVHLRFGSKSLPGGTATEMNSRIDVLMLGIFCSDKIVGVYSLAAMLAEGFDQIPSIFRVNYNPLLTKFVVQKRLGEIRSLIRGFLMKWIPFALIIGFLAILVFPLLVKIIASGPEFSQAWVIFAILMIGIIIRSGYSVFWELPVQSGYPGYQTILIGVVALSNILLNYVFIQWWGIYGAAIATTISFVLSVFYLKLVVRKLLDIKI